MERPRYKEPQGKTPGRVFINQNQYFEGVAPEIWDFHVGGYRVAEKWLKDRRDRELALNDIQHYRRTIAALAQTLDLMTAIDAEIEEAGGWPLR